MSSPKLIPAGPVIPNQTYSLVRELSNQSKMHAGLVLDKFSEFPKEGSGVQGKMMEFQRKALNRVCQLRGDGSLLERLYMRRKQMLTALGAHIIPMRNQGAFTLHLSHPGTWENAGIALHPIYGFVYLPGSGLKGLARAWAETVWAPAQSDKKAAWHLIEEAFGYTPNSEKHKIKNNDSRWRPKEIPLREGSAVGHLVFHDAWPSNWPRLEVDIVNSHHSAYYQGERGGVPDDTEDPNPVYFLAVGAGVEFEFAVTDRRRQSSSLVEQGIRWLRDALMVEGAGAKTAAGYGRFVTDQPVSVLESPAIVRKEYELELISMAFLAGANQAEQDCDLRPATLRGLLRWWWRTMHAHHVDVKILRRLEAAIWGDTETGSPVRIHLDRVNSSQAVHFDKNKYNWLPKNQGSGHGGQRQILGLSYASYGMDERDRRRGYLTEGSKWGIIVNTRDGYYNDGQHRMRLTASVIQRQVDAALWLFTQFGGAGSKSRKGFGSFADVKIEGISSIDDCKKIGEELRQVCSVKSNGSVQSPALKKAIVLKEMPAGTIYPEVAVHFVGQLLQQFVAKLKKEGRDRGDLGMPRTGSKYSLNRHASPAIWSLSREHQGKLLIRMIGFPSNKLPRSEKVLRDLRDFAGTELKKKAESASRIQRPGSHVRHEHTTAAAQPKRRFPSPNDQIEVHLVAEKTKKGDWKAKHTDSGLIGSFVDPLNAPSDVSAGEKVEVTVNHANEATIAFRWKPLEKKKGPPKRR